MAHILYVNYMMKLCKYFKSMGKYKFLKACAFCYTQKKTTMTTNYNKYICVIPCNT